MGNGYKGGEPQIVNQRVGTTRSGEAPEGGVEILAEVYFNDGGGAITEGFMLGVDGKLYQYNNSRHQISPFKQTHVHKPAHLGDNSVSYVLDHALIEYAPGRIPEGITENPYRALGFLKTAKELEELLGTTEPEPATKEAGGE